MCKPRIKLNVCIYNVLSICAMCDAHGSHMAKKKKKKRILQG